MKLKSLLVVLLALFVWASARAHDLFLKLDTYFLAPNAKAVVRLMNGTFESSEGTIARERLRNMSMFGPDLGKPLSESISWRDEGKTTIMELQTGGPGTYLIGVATSPKEISLKASEFNDYLVHDGLPDMFEARKKADDLDKDVRERYSKHVRAVFQVGNELSDDYRLPLNFPVEIVPLQNPYSLKVGKTLVVLCTAKQRPLVNQFVIAGWESPTGEMQELSMRTDTGGFARLKLAGAGRWYVKFIHMIPLAEEGLDYESKWASLTFEIR